MAVSTDSYFSWAIQGVPGVGGDINVQESNANPKLPIGQKYERADGAVFRYSHFGANTAAGQLVSLDVSESSTSATDSLLAPSATYQMPNEQNGVYPGAIGSKYVIATLASKTADQYAGGILVTSGGTGEGYSYPIVSNTATNNPATGLVRFQLAYPIKVAVATDTDILIQGNKFANLEPATAGTDMVVAGVATSAITIATAAYGWIQTRGLAAVLTDGTTIAAGDPLVVGAVAGSVSKIGNGITDAAALVDETVIAECTIAADATSDHLCAMLRIE